MPEKRPYLSRIAEGTTALLEGRSIRQYAAICFRRTPGETDHCLEVLLITTRESGRWVIPKGWAMDKKRPHEVAEQEAWEEAGVKGKARKRPFGYYTYMKSVDGVRTPSVVQVHLLEVEKVSERFPEKGARKIQWFPSFEAAALVREPELKSLIGKFENDAMRRRARAGKAGSPGG